VRGAQALISAGTVALVAGLAGRVVDRDSARLAALATAFYPLFVYTAGAMFPATLLIALVAGSVLLVLVALERDSMAAAAAAGLLAAWAGLAAASSFAALLLLAPWMVWHGVPIAARSVASRSRAWKLALVYLLPMVLIVGAWTARNQLVLGHPVLISTNGGYNLWLGNYPGIQAATGNRMNLPGMVDEANHIWLDGTNEVTKDRSFSSRGLEYITGDLPRFIRLTLSKARILWAVYVPPMTVDRPRLRMEKLASMLSYGLLLPFAAGWVLWTLRRNRLSVLVVCLSLAYTAVHAVVMAKTRYRLPLDVFVIIYGTGAVVALARALMARTMKPPRA
jgi:4-amino-4-deoxy-L-arabinose transferase-like glycosyltransferase